MFNNLFEKIRRVDEIESKLLSIFEGKTWNHIALALYGILDDIDTADDICKENTNAFRNMVMKLQAKKNEVLYSPDGYTVEPVVEIDEEEVPEDGVIPNLMKYNITKPVKVQESVSHIYGLDDDELLKFYRGMDRGYKKADGSRIRTFDADRKEVEVELKKRGLEIPKMVGMPVESKLKVGSTFEWGTLAGSRYKGIIKEIDSNVLIVELPDGTTKTIESSVDEIKENLTGHAQRELELAGLCDKDSDYNGMIGEAVLELMKVFASQGHSGMSATLTSDLFRRLSNYEALTELTDNSDEWNDISEYQGGKPGWQSQRSPSCFSEDRGKTYWDINEEYYFYTDENGDRWSGGLSEEEWKNRPMHTSKHVEKEE